MTYRLMLTTKGGGMEVAYETNSKEDAEREYEKRLAEDQGLPGSSYSESIAMFKRGPPCGGGWRSDEVETKGRGVPPVDGPPHPSPKVPHDPPHLPHRDPTRRR